MQRLKRCAYALVALVATIMIAQQSARAENVPEFEDYILCTKPMKARLEVPQFNRQPEFKQFRTRITNAAQGCVNFGGAFTLVIWGCGTECQGGAIIDRTDGRMYWLPIAAHGYEYRADSTLLVVNPMPESIYTHPSDIPDWAMRQFYDFRNGQFALLHTDRGSWPSDEHQTTVLDNPHPVRPEILKMLEDDILKEWCQDHPLSEECVEKK